MLDTIAIEDLNVPAVGLVHEGFIRDARAAGSHAGMPGVRILPETIPFECTVAERIEPGVDAVLDDIIAALVRPLTEEEKSPRKEASRSQRIAFTGTLQDVNRFFYKRRWTDGLPILPPTDAAVAEMLEGTDLPPDHVVGELEPQRGKATVEKIAINAVMAGALPTHMPLLIAAVQTLTDPRAHFPAFSVSTGSFAPSWIVNGPIRNQLKINSGPGVMSPGDLANSAIGRAMQFIIRNIGGARKGIEDMGSLGNPGKSSMIIAEREEDSPWKPMGTEHGFESGENTVTFFMPNSYSQAWPYGTDAKGILNGITASIIPAQGLFCLVLPPAHAKVLADAGWTKEQIKAYISEYARVPAYKHPIYWNAAVGVQPKEFTPLNPMDSQRILRDPDWIRIVVAGGPGNWIGLLVGFMVKDMSWVSRKVELPANWNALVRRYGNI